MLAPIDIALFLLTGFVSGVFGGLLGLGGATVLVPALTLAIGLPIQMAIAVSLISNAFVSGTAVIGYGRRGLLHRRTVIIMNAGSVVGIVLGTLVATRSPAGPIKLLFGVVLLALIAEGFLRRPREERDNGEELEHLNVPGLSVLGFVMGLLGALLGIGGGAVAVPVQTSFFRIPLRNAIANSLGTIVVSASIGAILYFLLGAGTVFPAGEALLTAAAVVPGSILGATVATSIAEKVPPRHVKFIFYAVLLYISYNMIKSGIGW